MKKPVIALAVLLVAAGVSTGAFLAVKSKNDKEVQKQQEETADNVLFDFDSGNINRIEISIEDTVYTAELSEEKWILTSPESFSLNQKKMQNICEYIGKLTAETNYGAADDEKKAMYGLENPFVITVSDGETSGTLRIGDVSPTKDYYYAEVDGKNNIYAIAYNTASEIITDRMGLKNNELIPYDDNDIVEMILRKDGKTVYDLTLDKDSYIWKLPEEYSMLTINQTVPSNMVTMLTRLEAEKMLEDNLTDLSVYGFDDPAAEFIIKGSDGTEKSMLMSYYGDDSDTYIHVLLEDTNQAEIYYTSDLKFIEYDIFDLIMQTVEGANMYSVTGFEFDCDSAGDEFSVDISANTAECRGNSIDLSNAEIMGFFKNFYNSFAYTVLSGTDTDAEPEPENPVFTALYHNFDGSDTEITLVPSGTENQAYVFVNRNYTGTLTSTDFIENSLISSYKTLCEHAGFEPNLK